MRRPLTKKAEEFAKQIVLQAAEPQGQAYATAYGHDYKAKRPLCDNQASILLKKPAIKACVAHWQSEFNREAKETFAVDARSVLARLVSIDHMDLTDILDDDGNVLAFNDWPEEWRTNADIELQEGQHGYKIRKITCPSKQKNLEMLGKHIDVNAFKETIDHNHKRFERIERIIIKSERTNTANPNG